MDNLISSDILNYLKSINGITKIDLTKENNKMILEYDVSLVSLEIIIL